MNEYWMSAGSGPAHWIKLAGSSFYTTACQHVITRESARKVESERVGLSQRPGQFYFRPVTGEICPICERKAQAQA